MNVASLELSKELYELSGWKETTFCWFENNDGTHHVTAITNTDSPAYDLGFLIRKLVAVDPYIGLVNENWQGSPVWQASAFPKDVEEDYPVEEAATPENALCQLAIELHKAGIL